MKLDKKIIRSLRWQHASGTFLLIAIVALLSWLSTQYHDQFDLSAANRNTLTDASRQLLKKMPDPITVKIFLAEDAPQASSIKTLLDRYSRFKENFKFEFINPDTNPALVRALKINYAGELVVQYQDKEERLSNLNEADFSNALQRMLQTQEHWVLFLQGHGERNPLGNANHDFNKFNIQLENRGYKIQTINLAETPAIATNTSVLVIASPQVKLLSGEIKLINEYIAGGGNLLWLTDPAEQAGLESLATNLGIKILPGMIVDAMTQALGIQQVDFALVSKYSSHPVTHALSAITVFPQAVGLDHAGESFSAEALLQTQERSWTELSDINKGGDIDFNANTQEVAGPITLGFALTRTLETPTTPNENKTNRSEQRVIVVGDGDFLANAVIGNGGNLELGLSMMNWLAHDDNMLNVAPIMPPDTQLTLSNMQLLALEIFFVVLLPLALISAGVVIWLKRRKAKS
ncbi:MAG: GldG family protein [Gammaproteobacteria bacterium]|nr:GldG family protein [Gammaproteobacteria bacterium]